MAQHTCDSSEEVFTLRSDFARRTSHFPSVTESERQKSPSAADGDIEETLRVIDSAKRFLNNATKQHVTLVAVAHGAKPCEEMLRDMSKSTIKADQSCLDHREVESNQNNTTQEAFEGELSDIDGLKSNKSEMIHFLTESHIEGHMGLPRPISQKEMSQTLKHEVENATETNPSKKDAFKKVYNY